MNIFRLQNLLVFAPLLFSSNNVHAWQLPLPGGGKVQFDDGGVLRIRFSSDPGFPPMPPANTTIDPDILERIEVRDTGTIKGFGAFCKNQPLERDTFLGFYEGVLIRSREELEKSLGPESFSTSSMDYVMSTDGGLTFLDGRLRAQDRDTFSPVHLNHEDKGKPQCNCKRLLEEGRVAFFTSRRIEVGEELCFDYGSNYWKGRESMKI
jgi:hypothetical protein